MNHLRVVAGLVAATFAFEGTEQRIEVAGDKPGHDPAGGAVAQS